jgi:hypothetical protein
MIRRYGVADDSPVRDLRKLVDWFRSGITMPLGSAVSKFTHPATPKLTHLFVQ